MDTVAQICELLEAKKEKFGQYERATLAMLDCGVDDIENYITERAVLATEIDELDEEIARICDDEPNGNVWYSAAKANLNFSQVPPELQPVFEGGQQVRSLASRIATSEKQVVERLEFIQNEAMEKLREQQNVPKIKKYLSDLGDQPNTGSFKSEKA